MKVLLDTNAFLRWTTDLPLPRAVERRLARQDTECFISIVSAWEISIQTALELSAIDVEKKIKDIGATLLPIKFFHLNQLDRLPLFRNHPDPFDRLLIAQAIAEDLTMISSDRLFPQYLHLQLLWN